MNDDILFCGCRWSKWHNRFVTKDKIKRWESDPDFHRPNRWLRLHSRWNESLGRLDDPPHSGPDQSADLASRSEVENGVLGS